MAIRRPCGIRLLGLAIPNRRTSSSWIWAASIRFLEFRTCLCADGPNGTIKDYEVFASSDGKDFGPQASKGSFANSNDWNTIAFSAPIEARYVKLLALSEVQGRPWTSIAELKILVDDVRFQASPVPWFPVPGREGPPRTELEKQFVHLLHDLDKRAQLAALADQTFRADALILESDRDPADVVLRRTATLLADLERMSTSPNLTTLAGELQQLQSKGNQVPVEDELARYELYENACRLRRRIAFAIRCWISTRSCSSSAIGRCSITCATSTTAWPPRRAADCTFCRTPSDRTRKSATCWPTRWSSAAGWRARSSRAARCRHPLAFDGEGNLHGPRSRRWIVPVARPVVRRHKRPVRLRRVRGATNSTSITSIPTRGHWDEGRCYHVFQVNVDGSNLRATDRRHLERLRPLLAAQRTDRVHQRAARRLPAVRPGLSDVHAVRHGRRRQRHPLPEFPRDQRMAPQRHQRRADRLDALGLRRPARLHGPHALDHEPRRGRIRVRCTATIAPASDAARHGSERAGDPRVAQVRRHRGAAPRPGLRFAGDHRPTGAGRRRHGAGQADHARGRFPRKPGRRAGLRNALAVERGLLPVRLRREYAARRGLPRRSPRAGKLRDLSDRLVRQQGADLPRSRDRLYESDSVATSPPAAGATKRRNEHRRSAEQSSDA